MGGRSLAPAGHTCVYMNAAEGPGSKTGRFHLTSSNSVSWDCGSNGPTVLATEYDGTTTVVDVGDFTGPFGWAGCCANAAGYEGVASVAFSHEDGSVQVEMTSTYYTTFRRTNSLGCEGPVGRELQPWDGGTLSLWRSASPPGILDSLAAFLWHEGSLTAPSSSWWCDYDQNQWDSMEGTCGFRSYCAYTRRALIELDGTDDILVVLAHTAAVTVPSLLVRNDGPNLIWVSMTMCPKQFVQPGQTVTFVGYSAFAAVTILLQDDTGGAGAINVKIWQPTGASGRRVTVFAHTLFPNSVVIRPDTTFVGRRVSGTMHNIDRVVSWHRASWRKGFTISGEPGLFVSDGQTVDEDWEGT